jgi:hypothetical protein
MTSPVSAVEAIEKAMREAAVNLVDTLVLERETNGQSKEFSDWAVFMVMRAFKEQRADAARDAEALERAITSDFCVVFLDGRNEHGTHVLPSFPASFDADQDDIAEQADAIMEAAEDAGFQEGKHVWAEFSWQSPQVDNEGRTELAGYWDFTRINPAMSQLINRQARTLLKEEANAGN